MGSATADFGYFPAYATPEFKERSKKRRFYTDTPQKIKYRPSISDETAPVANLEDWFITHADKWQSETAIHSAPGATYLHRDYMLIIAKGIENQRSVIPLILNRLSAHGGDWFFALESIAGENPAAHCKDYDDALVAWKNWAKQRGFLKEGDALPAS